MKRIAIYFRDAYMKRKNLIEYDDEKPCLICEEPVISASMGGTVICPWCDMGKCRYCGVRIFVMKEEFDGGESKKECLNHMKWHRKREPDLNQRLLKADREFEKSV